jgi:threonine aldolase
MEGAHPEILRCLGKINLTPMTGYGTDPVCTDAKEEILAACGCPEGEVFFLSGGTQTNATVIDSILHTYEGVVSVSSGHISLA